jgi:hypothetical protein
LGTTRYLKSDHPQILSGQQPYPPAPEPVGAPPQGQVPPVAPSQAPTPLPGQVPTAAPVANPTPAPWAAVTPTPLAALPNSGAKKRRGAVITVAVVVLVLVVALVVYLIVAPKSTASTANQALPSTSSAPAPSTPANPNGNQGTAPDSGSDSGSPLDSPAYLQQLKNKLAAAAQTGNVGTATSSDPLAGAWDCSDTGDGAYMRFSSGNLFWYHSKQDQNDNYQQAVYEVEPGVLNRIGSVNYGSVGKERYTIFVTYTSSVENGAATSQTHYGIFEVTMAGNDKASVFDASTMNSFYLTRSK